MQDAQELVEKYNAGERGFSNAYLVRADLSGADPRRACLDKAYLNRTNLAGANLEGTSLYGAYLSGANLAGANLEGAHLCGADLIGATMPDGTARFTDPQEPAIGGPDPIQSLEGPHA